MNAAIVVGVASPFFAGAIAVVALPGLKRRAEPATEEDSAPIKARFASGDEDTAETEEVLTSVDAMERDIVVLTRGTPERRVAIIEAISNAVHRFVAARRPKALQPLRSTETLAPQNAPTPEHSSSASSEANVVPPVDGMPAPLSVVEPEPRSEIDGHQRVPPPEVRDGTLRIDAHGAFNIEPTPEEPNLEQFAKTAVDDESQFAEERKAIALMRITSWREAMTDAPWWMRLDPTMDENDLPTRRTIASTLRHVRASWSLALIRHALASEPEASVRARLLRALHDHAELISEEEVIVEMRSAWTRSDIERAACGEIGYTFEEVAA